MAMYQDIDPINQPNKDRNELMSSPPSTSIYINECYFNLI
ncbi:Uncharacterised protein [Legionella pneumophila subsp. pascullei]|uniref:Uncharacterized protein n=1 Tax=Legionella pneumophila subsp. pascullei TaxID=91890 RepID=A0AAX2IY67_LEGPN|nr:Uncharacterised protein [Legionella pneumophila subsp. pascullei]VEH07370.1 Uncharacterised protein [Legionella pneumophila subsp. pascullei]